MYQVNFYFNRRVIKTIMFHKEHLAEECLIRHANECDMDIREDNYYASWNGTIPEREIEIVYLENKIIK